MVINRPSWVKSENYKKINLSNNVHFDKILSKKVHNILKKKINDNHLRYADPLKIYRSISKYYKVPIRCLSIGFGATDIISRIIKILDVETFYIVNPSFEMVKVYCKIEKKKYKFISKHEINKIKNKKSAVYIVNPNSVDGSVSKIDKKIFNSFKYVIIDEVYADFYEKHSLLKKNYNNLIVIKSLSKSLGLAGLRVGFCKASEKITKKIQSIRMNQITSIYSEIIVPNTIYYTKSVIKRMIQSKKYLEKNYECKKSFSNYVLFKKKNKLTKVFGAKKKLGYFRMALTNIQIIKNIEKIK